VTRADGAPAVRVRVTLTRCATPVGGGLGFDYTDDRGRYRINGELSPALTSRVNADTLRVRCTVLLGGAPAPVVADSLDVRFWRDPRAVVPMRLDLRLP
jgi:hypothetical protein